jgi:hypothetical protein
MLIYVVDMNFSWFKIKKLKHEPFLLTIKLMFKKDAAIVKFWHNFDGIFMTIGTKKIRKSRNQSLYIILLFMKYDDL